MLKASTLKFLESIKKNNNRDWFEKNKNAYVEALDNFHEFLQAVIDGGKKFDSNLMELNAKKATMRIYRDVRFSKDKAPYKSNFGAMLNKGKKMSTAGYYVHLEPGNTFLAGGLHLPEADVLKKVRQEIAYNSKEFKKILNQPSFKDFFGGLDQSDKLVNAPRDYPADHPEIDLLKNKSFIVVHSIKDKDLLKKDLVPTCLKIFKAMKPLDDFLNQAIE